MQKNTQKGFTLIELLLVLAIIAGIGVAAFMIYPRVQAGNSATNNASALNAAAAQIQALFPSARYANLSQNVACKGDVFPDSFKDDTTCAVATMKNEWDGAVSIGPAGITGATATGNAARYYYIHYANVPSKVCAKLAPALASNFGIVGIGAAAGAAPAGTQIVVNTFDAVATNDVPNEANVANGCQTATGRATITVVGR